MLVRRVEEEEFVSSSLDFIHGLTNEVKMSASSSESQPLPVTSVAAGLSSSTGVMTSVTSNLPPTTASSTSSAMPPCSSSLVSEFESAYAEMLATLTLDDEFVSDKKRRTDAMWKQVRKLHIRFHIQ